MALVMLPSDLPWWDSVKRQLKRLANTKNTLELIEGMQKIYEMCSVSLDPDEEEIDPQQFVGLLNFFRQRFDEKLCQLLQREALKIKELRPKNGLHFSLQQQPDCTELEYSFVSSLLANAFFSTFPKRTDKTHPTLQNFNFSNFFKNLNSNAQKSKLKSFLYYFEWLENNENLNGRLKIYRQVMNSKEWLTIEDWIECNLPLCPVKIKHDGKLERCDEDCLQICFSSAKIGGNVLTNGQSQECINLITAPELLMTLLNIEALEDNEVLTVEKVRHIARISDPKHRATLEKLETAERICCIDADDYTKLPIGQYEEDNILRELNKCLLGFQQKQSKTNESKTLPPVQVTYNHRRRLSPIGESVGSNQSDPIISIPLITQQSCSTNRSGSVSPINEDESSRNKLRNGNATYKRGEQPNTDMLVHNRRGRFIVLGSSGECLPVSRKLPDEDNSVYSSCESSESDFHSAKTSLDGGSEEDQYEKRYSIDLETAERRHTFAQRLKDALRQELSNSTDSSSSESSYAVGISVTGSGVADHDIKVRRCGSTGFALQEDSLDEDFLQNSLQQERKWIDKFKSKQSALSRKESNKSSEYSFSTEYSSELEEVYEQFSRWLENPLLETEKETKRELDARELAVVRFAGSILKRTLSESFAGVPVPMTENCDNNSGNMDFKTKKNKLVLNAKSLSLELARQKHRLAAQLSCEQIEPIFEKENVSPSLTNHVISSDAFCQNNKHRAWFISCVNEAVIQTLEEVCVKLSLPQSKKLSQISSQKSKDGLKPVLTGNWGCGSSRKGDVQLKVIIQWLAASVAGVPAVIYYTCGHQQLVKLDTVRRILIDRKWTVRGTGRGNFTLF
ncbi:hypothetical protein NQ317_015055 [Molorchus minor]|uniref:poly(ADP-ribose) glycohydrolase n=1 Tax=Molorchus minor TaxID=1323400 RepID=A0ABQ9K659_9CUCU|nr:hypothetical protein NQ317_015055 [Molorchus minor]